MTSHGFLRPSGVVNPPLHRLALNVAIAVHIPLGSNLSIPGKPGNGIINDLNHILSSHRKLHIPVGLRGLNAKRTSAVGQDLTM